LKRYRPEGWEAGRLGGRKAGKLGGVFIASQPSSLLAA